MSIVIDLNALIRESVALDRAGVTTAGMRAARLAARRAVMNATAGAPDHVAELLLARADAEMMRGRPRAAMIARRRAIIMQVGIYHPASSTADMESARDLLATEIAAAKARSAARRR